MKLLAASGQGIKNYHKEKGIHHINDGFVDTAIFRVMFDLLDDRKKPPSSINTNL